MSKQVLMMVLCLMAVLISQSVYAEGDAVDSPVVGSWMLESVYENAASADRFVLEPENAASVYAERENICALLSDGTAELTMEGITIFGYWEKTDEHVRMVINRTRRASDESGQTEPDIVPPDEMEFFYEEEQNALHRYVKNDDPGATYHDLDFVYKKIPQGTWHMTKVYSREPGQEPLLLDPETSQSLYAEAVNRLSITGHQVINTIPAETEYIEESGVLRRSGDTWLIVFEDGFEMQLTYDDQADVLHRYWSDNTADATYHELDFVYEQQAP